MGSRRATAGTRCVNGQNIRHIARPWAAAAVLSTALVACAAQPDPGPDPTDPVVYDASAETKAATGIAKWGFSVAKLDGASVFRGYDEHNSNVVEIRESLDMEDPLDKHFVLTMTGSAARGSVRIDFVGQVSDVDDTDITYAQTVLENTVAPGSMGERILLRLAPDARTVVSTRPTTASPTRLVSQGVRPLATDLVSEKPSDLLVCCADLTRDSATSAANAATTCLVQKSVTIAPSDTSAPQAMADPDLASAGDLPPARDRAR